MQCFEKNLRNYKTRTGGQGEVTKMLSTYIIFVKEAILVGVDQVEGLMG